MHLQPETPLSAFLSSISREYSSLKSLADRAVSQLPADELFFRKPGAESNSIAVIMKHVGGNLRSRWTDFLTTDGEKESRDRDSEFVIAPHEDRRAIVSVWEQGWKCLFEAISSLSAEDLQKQVTIRGEKLSVIDALHRNLAHTAYHSGQIVYLSKMFVDQGWTWLTIAPGTSAEYNQKVWVKSDKDFKR
jgi:hypothetical protein